MTNPRRVLFVTVGTTAISATNLGGLTRSAADLRVEAADFLAGTDPAPDLFDRIVDAHQVFWRSKLPAHENPFDTSAEMVSTWYALRIQRRNDLFEPDRDQIVLLASDTDQGKFSARVNERLMQEHMFSKPCPKSSNSAVVEVIKGLEAKAPGFGENIAASLDEIWAGHNAEEETIVNITGGFKGTIPALTWLCERSGKSSMFYAYESMDWAEEITFPKGQGPSYSSRPIIVV